MYAYSTLYKRNIDSTYIIDKYMNKIELVASQQFDSCYLHYQFPSNTTNIQPHSQHEMEVIIMPAHKEIELLE